MIACYGQRADLKGKIVDTVNKKNIAYSLISVLNQKDSTLAGFTRSNISGSFIINDIPPGEFLLLITHPQFDEQWIPIKIPGDTHIVERKEDAGILDTVIDLDNIPLYPRSSTLAAAIVTQRRPLVRLKGDTVEYDAASVKTKINASVEDLLKQLPGVEVDQNGGITAQGEKIQKILIDGEEFFSDDPTIATRNLSASMIDKVQVLNKKSAQADFTGIDDGKTTKTLNLTLLENSKHGYFGKAEAGTDANQYYNSDALAGAFKGNRKLSVFAMASNTGQSSLSSTDATSFDDGDDISVTAAPGGSDNFGASGAIGGVPQTTNAGIHYSNKWNGDGLLSGQHLSGNYRYNNSLNNASSYTFTQETLPDSIYTQTEQANSISSKVQHTFSGIYDFALDSSSSFRLSFGGLTDEGHNQDAFIDTTRINNALVNSGIRSSNAYIDNNNMIGNVLWRKKFNHPGQTFSADASFHSSDQHTYGFLYSLDNYYQPGGNPPPPDTTDQRKDISTHTSTLDGNILYTTPLGKSWVLAAGYSLAITNNHSLNDTWNRGSGKYDNYVDSLSSQYVLNVVTQKLRLTTQLKEKHFSYIFGSNLSYSTYQQIDLLSDTSMRYRYLNLFPQMEVRYNISPLQSLSFNYYGSTQQPSIYQLQSTKNNNDPLNIVVGNPRLLPSFGNSFRISMNSYKPLAGRSFYVGISLYTITNSITNSILTDSLGHTVTQSVNTNGNINTGIYSFSSWDLHSLSLHLGINANLYYVRVSNFVNNIQDFSDTYTPSVGFSISRNISDEYNFNINSNINYTYSRNSINIAVPTHYWIGVSTAELGWSLPEYFELITNCNYICRQKINVTENINKSILWNVLLEKRLVKDALTARFTANDILNQNNDLNNSILANQLVQTRLTAIRRSLILSLTFNFDPKPKMQ